MFFHPNPAVKENSGNSIGLRSGTSCRDRVVSQFAAFFAIFRNILNFGIPPKRDEPEMLGKNRVGAFFIQTKGLSNPQISFDSESCTWDSSLVSWAGGGAGLGKAGRGARGAGPGSTHAATPRGQPSTGVARIRQSDSCHQVSHDVLIHQHTSWVGLAWQCWVRGGAWRGVAYGVEGRSIVACRGMAWW